MQLFFCLVSGKTHKNVPRILSKGTKKNCIYAYNVLATFVVLLLTLYLCFKKKKKCYILQSYILKVTFVCFGLDQFFLMR